MTAEATKTEVGSYFISNCPPFSQWAPEQLPEVRSALDSPPANVPLGLYLHIPFCRKRCKFCYFKVFTDKNGDQVERYVSALAREIELVSRVPAMGGRPFRFVYFGGGTPSFLSEKQLRRLVDRRKRTSAGTKPRKSRSNASPARSASRRFKRSANSASRGSAWASNTSTTKSSARTAAPTSRERSIAPGRGSAPRASPTSTST
jgi:oxygen-independent coproporphyrinogen-3 oxidase